jgi:hypothetical protein
MKFIKIFLASSAKMSEERKLFEIDINRLNNEWVKKEMFLDLEIWEEFSEYMVKEGKQNEYNESVAGCDIFVLLFSDFVGQYSKEEFNHAFQCFSNSPLQLPKIFTYFIEPPNGIKDKSTEEFLEELRRLKHYPSLNKSFEEVRKKFQKELMDLTAGKSYFFFPDLTPKINEKVQYIKMLHLTDKQQNKGPVYRKYIDRLQAEEDIYDEAQFFELIIYSGPGKSTLAYNYSHSAGTIDMNVIIPRQEPLNNKLSMQEDDHMKFLVRRKIDLNSNVFYSVTSFINAFQKGSTFYQTRADEHIKWIRLIIDFSALPSHSKMQRSQPAAQLLFGDKNKGVKELVVSQIKDGIYQAEEADLQAGDIVVMRFDIDWDVIS